MRSLNPIGLALAAALLAFATPTAFTEDGFTLKIEEKAPPSDLAKDIAGKLAHKSYQISDADGLFFEFWFVSEIPLKEKIANPKDALGKIEEVTLLGAALIHQEERYDFRDDPIDPGLFVIRLALQPQDGNHMGTAPFDTFAILLPHDKDGEVRQYPDHETLVELASEDTVAEHPPIFSLQPMNDATGDFPRLAEGGDEWHFLCLKLPAKAGNETFDVVVQLVFDGVGEL